MTSGIKRKLTCSNIWPLTAALQKRQRHADLLFYAIYRIWQPCCQIYICIYKDEKPGLITCFRDILFYCTCCIWQRNKQHQVNFVNSRIGCGLQVKMLFPGQDFLHCNIYLLFKQCQGLRAISLPWVKLKLLRTPWRIQFEWKNKNYEKPHPN